MIAARREIPINPCSECGKSDRLRVERDSIGCQRCRRYAVCTTVTGTAYCWNQQNPEK